MSLLPTCRTFIYTQIVNKHTLYPRLQSITLKKPTGDPTWVNSLIISNYAHVLDKRNVYHNADVGYETPLSIRDQEGQELPNASAAIPPDIYLHTHGNAMLYTPHSLAHVSYYHIITYL